MSEKPVAFVEIDEDDPFEAIEIRVKGPDGAAFSVGEIEAEPGRYELREVDDE